MAATSTRGRLPGSSRGLMRPAAPSPSLADVRLLDRLHTTRVDALVAVLLTLAGLVQALLVPFAPPGVGAVYVVGSTLPLAWRRTYPVEAALVSAAFWVIPLDGFPLLGFVAVVLQFFSLGARAQSRWAVIAVTAFASATSVVGTLLGPELPVAAVGALLVVWAPTLAGRLVRHLHQQNLALAALTGELREQRIRAEEAAVGAERARIAQELHDVVGHELTLIAIQAEAAAAALRVTPERAVEPVEAIRSTAHRTLAEIRQVLNALAPVGEGDLQEGEGLRALTDRAREVGIVNSLTTSGTPQPDQAPVSMAVHRIVRECLTNAGQHAPGQPVTLAVDWGPDSVVVQASNPQADAEAGAAARSGRGLTGIRHRAELLGGTYAAGCEDGRFVVRVVMPTSGGEPR